ncbi:MAG: glycosyltransferase, partial [Guyparkeria sp.]
VEVIENGVRTFRSERERPLPAGGLRLISVGSLTERKGLSVALEAVARLDCAWECYLIVGEGPERPRLEDRVAELGLSDKVEFLGWRDDVGALLAASDMQLIPSRWEGFGLAAVEGLSVGLPMVAADVPGLSEVVGGLPGVVLVDDHDPSSFADAIERMCRLRHRWPEFADAAIERARSYTVDAMATRHARLYRQVAAGALRE